MRVLYITLFAEPLNQVPTLRTSAFCKYLPEFGIEIDVLTRYYDQAVITSNNFNTSFSLITDNIELPIQKGKLVYSGFSESRSVIKKFESLPPGLNVLYSIIKKDIYHAGWVESALQAFEAKLKSNKYDYIIASYSPIVTLQVGALLSKKYNIPWIAEFRDPYTDDSLESRRAGYIKRIIVNGLLKTCSGVISVCGPINDIVDQYGNAYIRNLPKVVVNNGVDISLQEEVQEKDKKVCDEIIELKKKYFVLVHTGSIYQGQNIGFFVKFIEQFNSKYGESPLLLVCVGLAENMVDTGVLNSRFVKVLKKVDLRSSLFIQREADALVLPTWLIKVYSGFAAKVFEYIHSGNNVLCSPDPTPDLKDFIVQFENVFIAQDFESMEKHVIHLVEGRNQKEIKKNESKMLFRKYWIGKLAEYLKNLREKTNAIL